jgi:hypothetical protein
MVACPRRFYLDRCMPPSCLAGEDDCKPGRTRVGGVGRRRAVHEETGHGAKRRRCAAFAQAQLPCRNEVLVRREAHVGAVLKSMNSE